MFSKELKTIVEDYSQKGAMAFFQGATEEQIISFEKKNKITFPSEYKEWLLFSDGGELFLPSGVQMYGVSHKPIIDVNDNDRPNDDYIVIGALATGDPVLFSKKSGQVSVYNHEGGRIEEDETYSGFFAFLSDLISLLGIER